MKSPKSVNKVALLKLSFDMLSSNKEWATFYRSRFHLLHKPAIRFCNQVCQVLCEARDQSSFTNGLQQHHLANW